MHASGSGPSVRLLYIQNQFNQSLGTDVSQQNWAHTHPIDSNILDVLAGEPKNTVVKTASFFHKLQIWEPSLCDVTKSHYQFQLSVRLSGAAS